VREKDFEGNWVSIKAYEFNHEKLRRVAKKYGYELVTKLQTLPSSEGAQAPNSTLKTVKKNVEKSLDTPRELGKLDNSVTTLGELEKTLRDTWQTGTTEQFLELIHQKSNLDRVEANAIVVRLIDEGRMGYDPEGWLVWVR